MARIITDLPSSGKPLQLFINPAVNSGFINLTWSTLVEAPDFSVPSTGESGITLDPADDSRELRPGEVFIETPLMVANVTNVSQTVEVKLILQAGGGEVTLTPPTLVPALEQIFLPLQGFRLLKTNFAAVNGDRLQLKASANSSLVCFGSASELGAANHAPNTD